MFSVFADQLFYSCGKRRQELMSLHLYDLDTKRGTLMIRQGKGSKDRMLPVGERALGWADKYITDVTQGETPLQRSE